MQRMDIDNNSERFCLAAMLRVAISFTLSTASLRSKASSGNFDCLPFPYRLKPRSKTCIG